MRSRLRRRSSRSPPQSGGQGSGDVRLTRLLALVALSPAQAVEVSAGLLAVIELDQAREQGIRTGLRSTGSRSTGTAE